MRIYSGVPASYDLLKLLLKGPSKPPETAKEATGHGRGVISWGTHELHRSNIRSLTGDQNFQPTDAPWD